jgi:hypothetical protein
MRATVVLATLLVLALLLSASPVSASATATSPGWSLSSVADPTDFNVSSAEAERDRYTLTALNVGSVATKGTVTITDTLPAQLAQAKLVGARVEERPSKNTEEKCSLTPPVTVICPYNSEPVSLGGNGPVRPGEELVTTVYVEVPPSTGALENEATIEGGAAATVHTSESTPPVNSGPAPFGIEHFAFETAGLSGEPDLQAGDHPYGVTTSIAFNSVFTGLNGGAGYHAAQEVKDVATYLPLGFVGDVLATERCPEAEMTYSTVSITESGITACPPGSVVGYVWITTGGEEHPGGPFPLYNIVPAHGYPAELAFSYANFAQPTFLYASVVPSGEGYRLRIATPGVPRVRGENVNRVAVTVFGDPSAHEGGSSQAAFVTNPASCTGEPLTARLQATSWEGGSATSETTAYPQITGCDLLQGTSAFSPRLELSPEETPGLKPEEANADTPSGYEVKLSVPQAPNVFGQLATAELKDATVTLPTGLSLSPSAASGPNSLEGCTPEQIDLQGVEAGEGARNGSPYDDGETHASPGHCPEKSRIGDVEVKTPLLPEPLHGHVYVAQPRCGGGEGQKPCTANSTENGELYSIYLEMSGSGVIVKLKGNVSVNPATGQIATTFKENPQLPFEELKMTLSGGQRSALANPQTCGAFTTTSDLEPWSAPESGASATPSWPFAVTGCASPMPFAPGFSAGAEQTLADGFSPFTTTLTRKDGEQDLGGVSVTLPPGVAGMISQVPLCGEAQASAGTCPEASRIGTAHVAAGAGSLPLWLEGRVYLTGPYNGDPFGLSIVVPAKAGPFDLGDEVVRAGIGVNPKTAQVSVTSEPLRLIRDGVPFRIKAIGVTVDRPQFTFNPTNCQQLHVTGSLSGDLPDGSPGATAAVSTPFAVVGCRKLPFRPGFSVLTHAGHTRTNGEYLHVVVRSGAGQANIADVHVALPKQLPSRVSTLNLACTEAQFAANPANCPSGSKVGTATAHTPVLPVPLTGPAIFVSHGGAAFPDLDIVLQGDGVTVILTGNTFIKNGITTSTFASVPDVPVTRFDLVLPAGPHSALGGNGNLCYRTVAKRVKIRDHGRIVYRTRHVKKKLALFMPTTIAGQNGSVVRQDTRIAVLGCAKSKARKSQHRRRNQEPFRAQRPSGLG